MSGEYFMIFLMVCGNFYLVYDSNFSDQKKKYLKQIANSVTAM